jgi:alpha-ribazole phosphatase/probable phosphoglycerate mutase
MTLYWTLPEIFPAPKSVETTASLRERSSSFLRELEEKNYGTVLIACHGGIMRALSGYLEDKKNGLAWRPKPHNCEVRVYEAKDGRHRTVERIRL